MTNEYQYNSMKEQMITSITEVCSRRKSGRIVFTNPIECGYESNDSGFMVDGLAMVNSHGEAVFVCEGEEIPSHIYDFEYDERSIVAAYMVINDITLTSLADLCDKLRVCTKIARKARRFAEYIDRRIGSADDTIISPINCNFEKEDKCKWYNIDATRVGNGKVYVEGWGEVETSAITLYSKCQIVDAMVEAMIRDGKITMYDLESK